MRAWCFLLLGCLGCGPAVQAPPVPDWRREVEGLQAKAVLDEQLARPGQARLAFLQDFQAGAPELADAPDRAVGDPAALRAIAFRAVERRAPGWRAVVRTARAAAPSDPGSLGLSLCARQAGVDLPMPGNLAGAQAALRVRVEQDPRAWRALWWVTQALDPAQAQRVAAAWATHWPTHGPAWAAVGAGPLPWADRLQALTRAAESGHVGAMRQLVGQLEAGDRHSAAAGWRDRLRRRGLDLPVDRESPEARLGSDRGSATVPVAVKEAADALPSPRAGERWRIYVDGWLVERAVDGRLSIRPRPRLLALAFDGPLAAERSVLVVVRSAAPVPLGGPTPKSTRWAGRAAWRAELESVQPAAAGVPEAYREGLGLVADARQPVAPAAHWVVDGELDRRGARFAVTLTARGEAVAQLRAAASAPAVLWRRLSAALPLAQVERLQWTAMGLRVSGRLHAAAPGPWLPAPLPFALAGLAWPGSGSGQGELALALPSLRVDSTWHVRGAPAHWRGGRGWFNVDAAGPWGTIRQAVQDGDDPTEFRVVRGVEFLQPALLAGDVHGRAELRRAAGRWAPATPPVGGE